MTQRKSLCAGRPVETDAFRTVRVHESGRAPIFNPDHADSFSVDKLASCNRSTAAYDKTTSFPARTNANESYVLHASFIDNYQH